MNSTPVSLKNESEKTPKDDFNFYHHFKKMNIHHNKKYFNRHEVELKCNLPPMVQNDSPRKTSKYSSLIRHKLTKSISNTNCSLNCNQSSSCTTLPVTIGLNNSVTETEFLQYRNANLLRSYNNDALLTKIRNECNSLFSVTTIKLLDNYMSQLQQHRQAETQCLFTKFNSASSSIGVDFWKEVVSLNYELVYCLIKIIEVILLEYSKEKKLSHHNHQHQHPQLFVKLPQMNLSSTPSSSMGKNTLKLLDNDKEETIRDLKQKLTLQEGQHKLNVYHLEKEIKDLTFLLGKQKDYSETNRENESLILAKNYEIMDLKQHSYKKIAELENEILSNRDKHNLIAESSTKLKKENDQLRENIAELSNQISDLNVIIHRLNMQSKEHQRNMQELLKEKEELSDEIKSKTEKHNDALLYIRDLEKKSK